MLIRTLKPPIAAIILRAPAWSVPFTVQTSLHPPGVVGNCGRKRESRLSGGQRPVFRRASPLIERVELQARIFHPEAFR